MLSPDVLTALGSTSKSNAKTEQVAEQFEKLFVQILLKQANLGASSSSEYGGSLHHDTFVSHLAEQIAASRSLGIADYIQSTIERNHNGTK